jgi:hypothetical protein
MTPDPDIERFLRHLYAAWFLIATVDDHFTSNETPESHQWKEKEQVGVLTQFASLLVRAFWKERTRITADPGITDRAIGFSAQREALWYQREDIIAFAGAAVQALIPEKRIVFSKKTFDLFYGKKPFTRRLAKFVDLADASLFTTWSTPPQQLDARSLLHVDIAKLLREEAQIDDLAIPFPGIPISGSCNGIVWIALRSQEQLVERINEVAPKWAHKPIAENLRTLAPLTRAKIIASDAESFGKRRGQTKHGGAAATPKEVRQTSESNGGQLTAELPAPQEVSWEGRATSLGLDAARAHDLLLLQLIAAVEHLGLTPAPYLLIKKLLAALTNEPIPWRMEGSIVRLEHEGWIQQGVSGTPPSAPRHADREGTLHCLHPLSDLGNCLGEVVRLLSKNKSELDSERYRRLLSTALLRIEDADLVVLAVARLERSDEFDEHVLGHAARALAKSGLFFEASMLLIRHRHLIAAENVRDVYLAIAIDHVLRNDAQVRNPIDERDAEHLRELQASNNAHLEVALAEHLGLRDEAPAAVERTPRLLTADELLTPSAVARVERFAKGLGDMHHRKLDNRTGFQKLLDALRYILHS